MIIFRLRLNGWRRVTIKRDIDQDRNFFRGIAFVMYHIIMDVHKYHCPGTTSRIIKCDWRALQSKYWLTSLIIINWHSSVLAILYPLSVVYEHMLGSGPFIPVDDGVHKATLKIRKGDGDGGGLDSNNNNNCFRIHLNWKLKILSRSRCFLERFINFFWVAAHFTGVKKNLHPFRYAPKWSYLVYYYCTLSVGLVTCV